MMTAPMVDYKIHWLKMMSVPESRAGRWEARWNKWKGQLRAALCLLQNPQSILRGELAPLRLGHDLRVRRWPRVAGSGPAPYSNSKGGRCLSEVGREGTGGS